MSTTIYLVRHGESEANRRNAFLGHCNLDITDIGYAQARAAADFLESKIGRPDAIYSSDLARAYHTAQCTAEKFNMLIHKSEKLREINAGLWENMPFEALMEKFPENYKMWMENIGRAYCDGGESVKELQDRIVCEITRIAKKHDNAVVFLFTHATPIRTFAAYCLNKTQDEIKSVPWCANASVTKVIFDKGVFSLAEYSRDDFMGNLVTHLPSST